ncbi:Inactive Serine/Threonine-Protein Kinase Tex14 [Manis pentadactyla]|nr:Inactive Serine/Threonine-Protein Kinase Tex14 [Manis pentadactyla]
MTRVSRPFHQTDASFQTVRVHIATHVLTCDTFWLLRRQVLRPLPTPAGEPESVCPSTLGTITRFSENIVFHANCEFHYYKEFLKILMKPSHSMTSNFDLHQEYVYLNLKVSLFIVSLIKAVLEKEILIDGTDKPPHAAQDSPAVVWAAAVSVTGTFLPSAAPFPAVKACTLEKITSRVTWCDLQCYLQRGKTWPTTHTPFPAAVGPKQGNRFMAQLLQGK